MNTARAIALVAEDLEVEMPITRAVNAMILDKLNPREVMERLFERSIKEALV